MEQTFFPLGFPLAVSSNSEAVLNAARAEWSAWAQAFDEPPIALKFYISGTTSRLPAASEFHASGNLFAFAADANNLGVCDTRTRSGAAWLTAGAVEDPAYFLYHFLEGMALQTIVSLYLTPIHAGFVANKGRGVLLCGESCAGKSSLSYACARRGWTYLSDDASYLIRAQAGERWVLGHPHRLRLRPDASRLFPELSSYTPSLRANGKMSLEISTRALDGISTAPRAAVDRIVLLRRVSYGQARLTEVDPTAARAICEPVFYWWNERISADQQAAFNTLLAACRIFSLEYSNLDAAVDLLEGC